MKVIDISMEIHEEMTVYKNKEEKRPRLEGINRLSVHGSYETLMTINLHTGTHIDAPLHMMQEGATMETYGLERFITSCKVIDLTWAHHCITDEDLMNYTIEAGDTILFKTRNSKEDAFDPEFVYLTKEGAAYLAEKGVNGVGIDALGIERAQANHESHRLLFESGAFILEGLRLKGVEQGEYDLIALPIKIKSVEASLVRAVLVQRD
jgi:arylformamidase